MSNNQYGGGTSCYFRLDSNGRECQFHGSVPRIDKTIIWRSGSNQSRKQATVELRKLACLFCA